jgi:hypothetical protein
MKKLDITADVVTCLLREQFPDLAHLQGWATAFRAAGWRPERRNGASLPHADHGRGVHAAVGVVAVGRTRAR